MTVVLIIVGVLGTAVKSLAKNKKIKIGRAGHSGKKRNHLDIFLKIAGILKRVLDI